VGLGALALVDVKAQPDLIAFENRRVDEKVRERLLPDLWGVFVTLLPPPYTLLPPVRVSRAAGSGKESRVKDVVALLVSRAGAPEIKGLITGGRNRSHPGEQ
jgi:hypothetical protein